MAWASSSERAVAPAAWRSPSSVMSSLKRWRSSARSMASGEVPRIGTPASRRGTARLSGVWPPNWTTTPSGQLLLEGVMLGPQDELPRAEHPLEVAEELFRKGAVHSAQIEQRNGRFQGSLHPGSFTLAWAITTG